MSSLTADHVCWKCGQPLGDEPLPLARAAACGRCGTDLHVCRMCEFYDTTVANQCREPVADRVTDKQRANFCGYLKLRPQAYAGDPAQAGAASRAALGDLFGMPGAPSAGPAGEDAAREALEDLFKR